MNKNIMNMDSEINIWNIWFKDVYLRMWLLKYKQIKKDPETIKLYANYLKSGRFTNFWSHNMNRIHGPWDIWFNNTSLSTWARVRCEAYKEERLKYLITNQGVACSYMLFMGKDDPYLRSLITLPHIAKSYRRYIRDDIEEINRIADENDI